MVIVAVTTLFLMTTTITAATQQSVYAQPNSSNSRACPEGTTLNRGVCVSEPSLVCNEEAGFVLKEVENFGLQCVLVETEEPICIDPFGNEGAFDPVRGLCLTALGNPSNVSPQCRDVPDSVFDFRLTQSEELGWHCERVVRETPTQECTIGTLNRATGLCEIKPGRGSSRA